MGARSGTPFDEVGDTGEKGLPFVTDGGSGAAFARWGERRLIWALSQAINALHLYFKKETLLKSRDIRALMSTLVLDGRQLEAAPLYIDLGRAATTKAHLEVLLTRLHQSLRSHMPQAVTGRPAKIDPGIVRRIYISAFGFSRGAAAARAYTSWLLALCELDARLNKTTGHTLGGFPVTFDFLGLFDTVASVGTSSMAPTQHGHAAWADAERSLRVPAEVKCLHLVWAHEQRRCFPLDSISVRGAMSSGAHREVVMPGVHSDIGGGYGPLEQGRGRDLLGSDKLSRVALAVMYKEARLSGAPLKLERARPLTKDRFRVHPDLLQAVNDYLSMCSVREGTLQAILQDQMQHYLLWRKACAGRLATMPSVRRATEIDQNDLISADDEFQGEMAAFERWVRQPFEKVTRQDYCPKPEMGVCVDVEVLRSTVPGGWLPGVKDARLKDWSLIKGFWGEKLPQEAAHLFCNYVHDSRAAFKLAGIEASEVEAELKRWVVAYDAILKQHLDPQNRFSTNEIGWIKEYKTTGRIPPMKMTGREPFELGAGYLRFRQIYSGANAWPQQVFDSSQGLIENATRAIRDYFSRKVERRQSWYPKANES